MPRDVGVLGCGVISRQYAANARPSTPSSSSPARTSTEARRSALAEEHDLAVASVGRADRRPVDRRRPQPDSAGRARGRRSGGARGGQARLHREAARHRAPTAARARSPRPPAAGLRIGCAPDMFLGSAYQAGAGAARRRRDRRAARPSARRCSSAARRPGTRTRTSSSRTAPARCSTWGRTT